MVHHRQRFGSVILSRSFYVLIIFLKVKKITTVEAKRRLPLILLIVYATASRALSLLAHE